MSTVCSSCTHWRGRQTSVHLAIETRHAYSMSSPHRAPECQWARTPAGMSASMSERVGVSIVSLSPERDSCPVWAARP